MNEEGNLENRVGIGFDESWSGTKIVYGSVLLLLGAIDTRLEGFVLL